MSCPELPDCRQNRHHQTQPLKLGSEPQTTVFLFLFLNLCFTRMGALPACLCTTCMQCRQSPEEGFGASGQQLQWVFPSYGCWELYVCVSHLSDVEPVSPDSLSTPASRPCCGCTPLSTSSSTLALLRAISSAPYETR